MADPYIQHTHIKTFAEAKVNLKREHAKKYREQVNRLREKLESFIVNNPDYGLVKMLHSGSVRKGTALKTINDMDVAVYLREMAIPTDMALLDWLTERLREANPKLPHDKFTSNKHCITVSFKGIDLDVDIVPVIYEDDPDDRGYLITKDTGDRVLTSIPLHLEFIRVRKNAQPNHFQQVVRLMKWWVRQRKIDNDTFRFKSFMVELMCAYLADKGLDMSDYILSLEGIFKYIVQSELSERISFTDYYKAADLPTSHVHAIEMFDPVNPHNNAASLYSLEDKNRIVDSAWNALDALTEAHHAPTKGHAVEMWKTVLGPSFSI